MNKTFPFRLLALNPQVLKYKIKSLGKNIGFTDVKVTHPKTSRSAILLKRWQALSNKGCVDAVQLAISYTESLF
ncbi:MAG: hypothetical protein ACWIPH_04355 [Ostreibacterium sp.]